MSGDPRPLSDKAIGAPPERPRDKYDAMYTARVRSGQMETTAEYYRVLWGKKPKVKKDGPTKRDTDGG
jgi:hypothetical protein